MLYRQEKETIYEANASIPRFMHIFIAVNYVSISIVISNSRSGMFDVDKFNENGKTTVAFIFRALFIIQLMRDQI